MDDIGIVEASEYMQYGIGFPDIGQKLVSQALSFARAFDQSRYIHDLHGRRYHPCRFYDFFQDLQTFVGNYGRADIGFYRAKRKISRLGLSGADTIKKSGFAYIRQAYNSAFECHFAYFKKFSVQK